MMLAWLTLALAVEPIYVTGATDLGFGPDGSLWVGAASAAYRFVDGEQVEAVSRKLGLADGRGPVITLSETDALWVHDADPPRRIALGSRFYPTDVARTADGGLVVRGRQTATRYDASLREVERRALDCRSHRGEVIVVGDDVWLRCGNRALRWDADIMVPDELPQPPTDDAPWTLEDGHRLVDRATAELLLEVPGSLKPLVWTEHWLLARAKNETQGSTLLWADLTTGAARHLDPRGTSEAALSPDGRAVALRAGWAVELLDFTAGEWLTPAVVRHHDWAEVLAVSADGERAVSADELGGHHILWSRDGEAVVLPDARLSDTARVARVRRRGGADNLAHPAAFSPDGQALVTLWDSGIFAVYDGVTGALRWQGGIDRDGLAGPSITITSSAIPRGLLSRDTGEKRLLSPPRFTPDGSWLITAGDHGDHSLLLVWDAAEGEVVQRFRFEHRAEMLGFRHDGRLVVQTGDGLVALPLGRRNAEPEVVASYVWQSWVDDGGEVGWVSWDVAPEERYRAVWKPTTTPPIVGISDGRAVWKD